MKDSPIHLDGVVVGAVTRRTTHVAVRVPRVTLRARDANGVAADHSVGLEMRVWGGTVEQHPRRLPRPLSDWGLYHAGGKRSGPLCANFSASGNLRLVFVFDADEPLVITGSRLILRLLMLDNAAGAPCRTLVDQTGLGATGSQVLSPLRNSPITDFRE